MEDENLDSHPTFSTVSRITELLEPLTESEREHILRTVATWFRIELPAKAGRNELPRSSASPVRVSDDEKFSDRQVQSAKEFLMEKDPMTEVERLACLAFYLTHYK